MKHPDGIHLSHVNDTKMKPTELIDEVVDLLKKSGTFDFSNVKKWTHFIPIIDTSVKDRTEKKEFDYDWDDLLCSSIIITLFGITIDQMPELEGYILEPSGRDMDTKREEVRYLKISLIGKKNFFNPEDTRISFKPKLIDVQSKHKRTSDYQNHIK